MPNQVTDARVRRVSFVDRAATRDPKNPTQPRRKLLWKAEDAPNDPAKGGSDMTPEETQAALEKAEQERDAAIAERDTHKSDLEKAQEELSKRRIGRKGAKPADGDGPDEEDDGDEDDLTKADLTPAVRSILEKRDAQVAELQKRAESAEEIAKAERDERVAKEFISKAEKELPNLGEPEAIGAELKKFSEVLSKDEFDEHLRRQLALNAQMDSSELFKQSGYGGPSPREATGLPDLLQKAEELQKADSSITGAEAFRRAMKDPAVQAAYRRQNAA